MDSSSILLSSLQVKDSRGRSLLKSKREVTYRFEDAGRRASFALEAPNRVADDKGSF